MPWKGAAQFRLAGAAAKTSGAANRKWLDKATIPGSQKAIADRRGKSGGPSLAQDAAALAHEALNNLSVDLPRPIERQLGDKVDAARMGVGRRVGEAELLELVFADPRTLRLDDHRHRHFP